MRLFPASRPERLVFEVEAWRSTSQFACVSQPGPLRANRYRRFSRPCGIDVVLLIAIGDAGRATEGRRNDLLIKLQWRRGQLRYAVGYASYTMLKLLLVEPWWGGANGTRI